MVWPQVEEQVRKGLRHGAGDGLTPNDILSAIERGDMVLWVVHDGPEIVAAVVLEVVEHPAKRSLVVVMAAGRDFWAWINQVNALLRDYAQLLGVDTVEAVVRSGMGKWLSDAGWRKKATVMEMTWVD